MMRITKLYGLLGNRVEGFNDIGRCSSLVKISSSHAALGSAHLHEISELVPNTNIRTEGSDVGLYLQNVIG